MDGEQKKGGKQPAPEKPKPKPKPGKKGDKGSQEEKEPKTEGRARLLNVIVH